MISNPARLRGVVERMRSLLFSSIAFVTDKFEIGICTLINEFAAL